MKVYLAGKISGDTGYYGKFRRAEEKLKGDGHIVLNPAELPEGLTPEDYMAICFSMIHRADVAAFLPDWTESRGATLEHEHCRYIGKPVWYIIETELAR